jgi:hypothetical protein
LVSMKRVMFEFFIYSEKSETLSSLFTYLFIKRIFLNP